jgi:hypothetical protein
MLTCKIGIDEDGQDGFELVLTYFGTQESLIARMS